MKNEGNPNDQSNEKKLTTAVWVLGALLVLALIAAGSFWAKSNKYENETAKLTSDLATMDSTKVALEGDLGTLEMSYEEKIVQNEQLAATLEERVKEVTELQDRVKKVRSQLAKSQQVNEQINARLAQLESLRDSLLNDIAALEGENEGLRSLNNEIASELTLSKEQISSLTEDVKKLDQKNSALVSRLFQLAPAGFVADNFKVTAMRKNDKVTAKAGRASQIKVAFDIRDVPADYQKDEELYLVITKFDGNPVMDLNTRNVRVKSASPIDIAAADVHQLKLNQRQTVEMAFTPGRKFESGLYNALVYADHGFLGATSFELQ